MRHWNSCSAWSAQIAWNIITEYSFSVEYRKGSSHSLSRCPNPKDCDCNIVDMNENLKCGPCSKCRKRAVDMESNWLLGKFDRMKDVDSQTVRKNRVYTPSTNRKITAKSGENRHNISFRCYLFISLCLCTVTGLYNQILQTISDYCMSCQQIVQTQFSSSTCNDLKQSYERPGNSIWLPRLCQLVSSPWLKLGRGLQRCAKVTTRSHLDVVNYVPWAECITPSKLKEMQLQDEDIQPLFDWLETSTKPNSNSVSALSPSTRHYLCCWDDLVLKDGIIFRKFDHRDGSNNFLQLLTPYNLQKEVLQ